MKNLWINKNLYSPCDFRVNQDLLEKMNSSARSLSYWQPQQPVQFHYATLTLTGGQNRLILKEIVFFFSQKVVEGSK